MLAAPRRPNLQRIFALAALSVFVLPASSANDDLAVPRFVEIAEASGLRHVFESDDQFDVGGGVAAFDCDGDMDADLFLAGGNARAGLYRNVSEPETFVRFADISDALGLDDVDARLVSGAYALDFDNDGDDDLFVMRFGENWLLKNDGQCNFSIANGEAGIPESGDRTMAFSAAWRSDSARPDLFVGNHVAQGIENGGAARCGASHVLQFPASDDPAPVRRVPIAPSFCPLSYLLVDWSGHGQFDLRAANDLAVGSEAAGDGEQLFRVGDEIAAYGEADGWTAGKIAGAGLAARDIDGDGRPETAVSGIGSPRFYVVDGEIDQPTFADQATERGISAEDPERRSAASRSWHIEFADFNNDAVSDLLIIRGWRQGSPEQNYDSLLLGRPDGTFVDSAAEAGLATDRIGRGAAIADFDRDGCQDIVIVNRDQPVSLMRNRQCDGEASPGWLDVELAQDGFNSDAIGASVILRAGDQAQTQAQTIGGGHAGGALGPLHFGLHDSPEAILRVRWPDGSITDPITIPANRYAIIRRSGQTITVNMGE